MKKGFTLIELLVVITIIAILAIIGLLVLTDVLKEARDTKRKADIDSISKALEAHYNRAENQYCTAAASTYCALKDEWFHNGKEPKDPQTDSRYDGLSAVTNGVSSFMVCARLEGRTTTCTAPASGCYCRRSQR